MPKEIANKTEKGNLHQVQKCADEIFIDTRKKMTYRAEVRLSGLMVVRIMSKLLATKG